jgi:hypothetical protein
MDPDLFKYNQNVQTLLSIFRISTSLDVSFDEYIETFKAYPFDDVVTALSLYLQEKRRNIKQVYEQIEHREKVLKDYKPKDE